MQTLSVSEVNAQIKGLLEATFIQVRVSGEVSNFTHHSSGHLYFTIKDKESALKCVMFRGNAMKLKFQIQEGMELTLEGAISVYAPRGEYQLNCAKAYPNGIGELTLAYEQLKESYAKKGYFANKKSLPKFPKKIALLTSSTGAVLHDMLRVAQKRWNLVEFVVLNTLVQGEGAMDCIVLARGGGSLEDLWAFNEPLVIEAIFNAKTPIVSAIGHEPDVVLSDFVADLRAPTPSAAMEQLLPDQNEWLMLLDSTQERLNKLLNGILQSKAVQIKNCKKSLDENPFFRKLALLNAKCQSQRTLLEQKIEHKLALSAIKLQTPNAQIHLKMEQALAKFRAKLESLKVQLEAKNPNHYQRAGYVCALSGGKKIKKLSEVSLESLLELQDKSAVVQVKVKSVQKA